MAKIVVGRNAAESSDRELEVSRSTRSPAQVAASNLCRNFSTSATEDNDKYELKWAEVERLRTYEQTTRTSNFDQFNSVINCDSEEEEKKAIEVTKLGAVERHTIIEKLIKHIEHDNLRLLQKQRERIDRVNVNLPTIEVRYRNLRVEADCEVVRGKPLPTLWNSAKRMASVLAKLPGLKTQEAKISILKDVNGIIKPSRKVCRMTLLLGPPGCGKTTLLQALAGRLDKYLKVTGEVEYNGYKLNEFVPGKTSAYVSQYDLHTPEMTVRETLDFSARFQGVGSRAEIMKEVCRREKQAGIIPDHDIDTYMKAISAEGLQRSLQTDYILKIMGLDKCADTMVGDAMRRGISGGEKKRLTTGEMLVGPRRALFMDEISTGLDSSTTFQIISCLQQLAHVAEYTVVISLLQPAPETYNLFDDIILMAEGKVVYNGPCSHVLTFFEESGFKCPERKGAADFLQEILSKKDQEQYWVRQRGNYSYISVDQFAEMFESHNIGQRLKEDLSKPYDKFQCHKDALSFSKYSLPKWQIFKACMARELLLMKRNSFVYISKAVQIAIVAIITGTVFLHTQMEIDMLHANYYLGSLFFSLLLLMVNGNPELSLTVSRLSVFYKQKDLYFYPAWAYAIPASMLKIPISLIESFVWTSLTYYLIGYSPEATRFFRQLLLLFLVHQMSVSMYRLLASYFQTMEASTFSASICTLVIILLGGFLLPHHSIPSWLTWGFWVSPLTYVEIALAINEFLAPRWQKISLARTTIGHQVLTDRGLNYKGYFYWIAVGALFGFIVLFNTGFTLALTFKRSPGVSRAIISHEKLAQVQGENNLDKATDPMNKTKSKSTRSSRVPKRTGKIVLPFIPLTVAFLDINYYVDTPKMRQKGYAEKRLQLLHNITGTFQPGILSALMGVSGAGKTTLLDVLAGRKTGGIIEGEIRIGGYPKVQKTFTRISGYCEQFDIHSPQITVEESVAFSAWLRLPPEINSKTRNEFVNEVLEAIELDEIRDALVGRPGVYGLSTEQRKRLTIAVELVSNPSIIFMDEPTSGLDARAAAIVMRAVKSVAETGRTVVCTIHQPSIDILEAFDELILMKKGGQVIYSGPMGRHSSKVIEYFEGISGVPRIKNTYNPATWMLEVTSPSTETQLCVDFAQIYRESSLYKVNEVLVKKLSTPPHNSKDISFPNHFPQNGWVQFKACLWKQCLSYWRSPSYNLVRIIFMIVSSTIFAVLFWKHGKRINNQQDLFNILGFMYATTLYNGIKNCASVQPYIAVERTVLYRENFAGMYSPWAYSFAQVAVEIPYALIQVALFLVIVYPAIGYAWTAYKFFWFFYTILCTLLYYTYLGMMLASLTPNIQMASILASACYQLQNIFAGFIVPSPQIPKWWIWFYYICPLSWVMNGLFTSQYGDLQKEIMVLGETKSVASFLEDYFGYHHNRLGVVAVALLAFPLFFASLFAFSIGKVNFQRR